MRNVGLVGATLTAVAIAAAACNGGGGGGGGLAPADGRITNGRYLITTATNVKDECVISGFEDLSSSTITVTVNGTSITIEDGLPGQFEPFPGTYENGIINIDFLTEFDWGTTYDCIEDNRYTIEARTPTDSTATEGTATARWSVKSGTECDQAYVDLSSQVGQTISLPCETVSEFEFTKFLTVTGTLTTAQGMTAVGVTPDAGSAVTGTDFRVAFNLGTGTPVAAADQTYDCYAPALPDFPNYDIISSDGATYAITISVPPAMWSAGTKAVATSGAGVFLTVATVDGNGGSSGGGSLNIISAPTTTTGACSFAITAPAPLSGEVAPVSAQAITSDVYTPFVHENPRTKGRKTVGVKPR